MILFGDVTLSDLLGLSVVFLVAPLCLIVAWRLTRLSRLSGPRLPVLLERRDVAIGLLLIEATFAIVFVNNDLPKPVLNLETTRLMTRGVLVAVPMYIGLRWLWLYRKAGKDGSNGVQDSTGAR